MGLRALRRHGWSVTALAREFRLNRRTVRGARLRSGPAPWQALGSAGTPLKRRNQGSSCPAPAWPNRVPTGLPNPAWEGQVAPPAEFKMPASAPPYHPSRGAAERDVGDAHRDRLQPGPNGQAGAGDGLKHPPEPPSGGGQRGGGGGYGCIRHPTRCKSTPAEAFLQQPVS
jgi:hypothetical protein